MHLRVDGSTPLVDRFARIAKFNDPTSPITVLLVSTKACGEGVNMVRDINVMRMKCSSTFLDAVACKIARLIFACAWIAGGR